MLKDCNKYLEAEVDKILKDMETGTGFAVPEEYQIWFKRGVMFGVSAAGKMLASIPIDTSKSI